MCCPRCESSVLTCGCVFVCVLAAAPLWLQGSLFYQVEEEHTQEEEAQEEAEEEEEEEEEEDLNSEHSNEEAALDSDDNMWNSDHKSDRYLKKRISTHVVFFAIFQQSLLCVII